MLDTFADISETDTLGKIGGGDSQDAPETSTFSVVNVGIGELGSRVGAGNYPSENGREDDDRSDELHGDKGNLVRKYTQ